MSYGALTGKRILLVFFQSLDDHEIECRENGTQKSLSGFLEGRMIHAQSGERMVCTESLWIAQMFHKHVSTVCIRKLGKKRPESRDGFMRKPLLVFVQIVIKACLVVPHKGINPRLQTEIHLFVLEAHVFVVQDVSQSRHMGRVDCHAAVEVHREESALAGRVEHRGESERHGIKTVRLLESGINPIHIAA